MCTHANSRFTVEKVIENKHLAVGSGGGVNYITSQQTDRARYQDGTTRPVHSSQITLLKILNHYYKCFGRYTL